MPEFLVTGPDGKPYRVAGDTAEGAALAVQQMQAGPSAGQKVGGAMIDTATCCRRAPNGARGCGRKSDALCAGARPGGLDPPGQAVPDVSHHLIWNGQGRAACFDSRLESHAITSLCLWMGAQAVSISSR